MSSHNVTEGHESQAHHRISEKALPNETARPETGGGWVAQGLESPGERGGGSLCGGFDAHLGEDFLLETLKLGDDFRAAGKHRLSQLLVVGGIPLSELRKSHHHRNGVVHRVLDLPETFVQREDLAAWYERVFHVVGL